MNTNENVIVLCVHSILILERIIAPSRSIIDNRFTGVNARLISNSDSFSGLRTYSRASGGQRKRNPKGGESSM